MRVRDLVRGRDARTHRRECVKCLAHEPLGGLHLPVAGADVVYDRVAENVLLPVSTRKCAARSGRSPRPVQPRNRAFRIFAGKTMDLRADDDVRELVEYDGDRRDGSSTRPHGRDSSGRCRSALEAAEWEPAAYRTQVSSSAWAPGSRTSASTLGRAVSQFEIERNEAPVAGPEREITFLPARTPGSGSPPDRRKVTSRIFGCFCSEATHSITSDESKGHPERVPVTEKLAVRVSLGGLLNFAAADAGGADAHALERLLRAPERTADLHSSDASSRCGHG